METSILRQLPVNGSLRKYSRPTTMRSDESGALWNVPLIRARSRSGTTKSPSMKVTLMPVVGARTFSMSTTRWKLVSFDVAEALRETISVADGAAAFPPHAARAAASARAASGRPRIAGIV
jgi:hypothetical protein